MILMAMLFVFAVYLAIFYLVARLLNRFCQRRGKNALGKLVGGLVMFSAFALVFWDAIPTWYTHHRLCETEAGLKVYMTPEEWARMNPEAYSKVRSAAGRTQTRRSENNTHEIHDWVESTPDFVYEYFHSWDRDYAFNTGIEYQKMIFKPTGKILFEEVNFYSSAGKNSLANGANSLSDYKIWATTGSCDVAYTETKSKFTHNGKTFSELQQQIIDWNKK